MRRTVLIFIAAALLGACAMPERVAAPMLYDFGPEVAAAPVPYAAARPALAVRVQASAALDGAAMLYRLAYADARQLRAYSQSRWAMTPAELVRQRLRAGLGRHYTLLQPDADAPRLLHVEIEEFSQLYTAPERSEGLLRMRASLLRATPGGEQVLGQREWQLQHPASSPDAAGGVRALASTTDAAVQELRQWLQAQR